MPAKIRGSLTPCIGCNGQYKPRDGLLQREVGCRFSCPDSKKSSQMTNNAIPAPDKNEQPKNTMSSIEISELSGKRHTDLLRSIRKMEPAWVKVNERKFTSVEYTDTKGEKRPMFELTKDECLYVATKFNDEARARLIVRWRDLENQLRPAGRLSRFSAKPLDELYTRKLGKKITDCYFTKGVIYTRFSLLLSHLGNSTGAAKMLREKLGEENFIEIPINKQPVYFANAKAFDTYCKKARTKPDHADYVMIMRDIFEVDLEEDAQEADNISYEFTDSDMLNIVMAIGKSPIRKGVVIGLIEKGSKKGGGCV